MNHIEHTIYTIYYECVYPKFFWNKKKRELSSPEFTVDLKKNRIYSESQSESDISDISGLSIPGENSMATQMESGIQFVSLAYETFAVYSFLKE